MCISGVDALLAKTRAQEIKLGEDLQLLEAKRAERSEYLHRL
jgi:hypothetical protein